MPGPGLAPEPDLGGCKIDLDSTICETYAIGHGGRPPSRLYRFARGYHPPAGRLRATGQLLGPPARGPIGQHRPGKAHFLAVSRWPGSLRRGPAWAATMRASRFVYLHLARSASAASRSPLLHHGIRQRTKASANLIGDTRRCLDRFLTGWTAPPMWPKPPDTPFQVAGCRAGPSSPAVKPALGTSNQASSPPTAMGTASFHPPGTGQPLELEAVLLPSAETRVCDTGLKYCVRAEPSPLGPLRRSTAPGWRYLGWPTAMVSLVAGIGL